MSEEHRFASLLSTVAREVTRRQASEVCCGDLTLEQFRTLKAISEAEESSIGSLSTQLGVDLSTMSRNLALLERNSYLTRARSAEDGRIVQVRLTGKGKKALDTLQCGEREVMSTVYAQLPARERPRIIKALEVLQTCLDQGTPAEACCPPSRARNSL